MSLSFQSRKKKPGETSGQQSTWLNGTNLKLSKAQSIELEARFEISSPLMQELQLNFTDIQGGYTKESLEAF